MGELMEKASEQYLWYYKKSKDHGRQPRPQILQFGCRTRDELIGVALYDSYQRVYGNPHGYRLLFVLWENGKRGEILEERWTWLHKYPAELI